MSNGPKRPPQFIGVKPSNSAADKYARDVAERVKSQARERRADTALPNLATIDKVYKSDKDGPMTVAQLGQAQETISRASEDRIKLKPETAAQLAAVAEATRRAREAEGAAKPAEETKTVSESETKPVEAPAPKRALNADEGAGVLADADFADLMERVRSDVINNERERDAIKKRVKEMDLADGLLTGTFKQEVPIKPGVLTITFRSISAYEIQEMRLVLFDMISKNELLGSLASDIFALMMACAGVEAINGAPFEPRYLRGPDALTAEFDAELFKQRVKKFSRYPSPLIHSIATHASWFDLRVRELFTTENVKNG